MPAAAHRASTAFLSICAIALAWWGMHDAESPALGTEELLQPRHTLGFWRDDALGAASEALARKSTILNRLLARGALNSNTVRQVQGAQQADMRALIHEGASLRQLRRALKSKARLLAKFDREAVGARGQSDNRASELAQLPQQTLPSSEAASSTSRWSTTTSSTTSSSAASAAWAADDAAGPLEKKKRLLDDILDNAAFNLGPEESDSYHAPETADLQDQIADIKDLAKQSNVLLPPLTPNSQVVHGARGLFDAHIEGKVVNVVTGAPVAGATVELVGPNKPLPPKMIEAVAADGPLHPEVDKILRNLARGFAVIGLKSHPGTQDATLGALQGETDGNGDFQLAAAPGIYSVLGDKQNYDPSKSLQRLCSPDHVTHVRVLLNPFLPRGMIRIVLTWGERWWNRAAKIADLELVIQTPNGCQVRLGSPETEIEPDLGPSLDKICAGVATSNDKPLASDIKHGGPITIELKDLEHGRYWVTVNERSRAAGVFDVKTMEFPLCSTILESTDAEVSVFSHEGGRQRFSVQKDGDVYGKGRCSWDVVGIDGHTHVLHRVYPEGHDQKPKLKADPYAKFDIDNNGNKIMQVPPAPRGVGIGVQGSTWPVPPDNILMNAEPGPYVHAPENKIYTNTHTARFAVQVSDKKENVQPANQEVDGQKPSMGMQRGVGGGMSRAGSINWPSSYEQRVDQRGWRIHGTQGVRDAQNDVMRGWHERGGLGGGTKEWWSRYNDDHPRRVWGHRWTHFTREHGGSSRDRHEQGVDRRGREVREYEWPDQPGRNVPSSHTPQDYNTWDREQWKRQRRPPNLIRPMWNPLTDFIPRDSAAFYSGTGGISVYPFKGMPALQLSVTMWVTTDTLQSAGTFMSYVAGPTEESLTLQESEMDARDLMIWVAGHGQRTGVQIADGYWHFIAVTWSSYDGATFLYVDGMLMFSTIMAKGMAVGDGGSLILGQDQRIDHGWCCSTLPNRAFTGQLADVALWNKPLGLDDVRAQINNEQGRAITGLVMKLKFRAPSKAIRDRGVELWDKVVPDSSGYHHDAVRVGMPLPTLMHRRVVSWKPPADVVAVGSKNETHQESEAHQAGEKKKIQDHSSLSTIKNEEIEFARGEAEYGRQGSSVTRKTGHLADTEANEMSVKADLMSSGTSKDQSLVESKQVGPGAAGQASDVSVEEGSQLSKFEPVHAVDARSEKEEQGRELLSEIFPDRLGPN